MQRRDLIKLAGISFLSIYTQNFITKKAFAKEKNNKVLVLIELKGGNDGLNTIIPFDDQNYYRLRPNIAINRDNIIKINNDSGFNPVLQPFYKLWQDRELAIVQGVGYPNPNRSHFRSIEIWETGSESSEFLNDGWISRSFINSVKIKRNVIDGIILGASDSGPLAGNEMNNLVMENPEQFVKDARKIKKLVKNTNNKALSHILSVEDKVYKSADTIESLLDDGPEFRTIFNQSNISKQMQNAAKLIASKVPVSVIKIEQAGYDTHTNQRANQDRLLKELAEAIYSFKSAMVEVDYWKDVVVMTYSEFGRRAVQNGSNGTDHGTAAPHFVIGGLIKGGLYGKQPSLDDLVENDLKFHVDYRSLYSTITKKWWGISSDFLVKYPPLDFL